ncbi:hypothetical protein L7F22_002074 [Adiantum nelumboides]|nr:hypothetical protein [Adiantum nelumboides]
MPMDLLVIMRHIIRKQTVALDAAGNTTTAIGKGFAIGSAALVSLALFEAYVSHASLTTVDVLSARAFVGLIVGAMLPYWFSAMTMKSVGKAALSMVEEVCWQFNTIPRLMEGVTKPDYATCVNFFIDASLREMISSGALVMLTPLIVEQEDRGTHEISLLEDSLYLFNKDIVLCPEEIFGLISSTVMYASSVNIKWLCLSTSNSTTVWDAF